ncbi:MAG: phage holin family protein [Achromobacter sp.]|nr:phage holin family protein [Achromobacter sp.]
MTDTHDSSGAEKAPSLEESLREVGAAGRAAFGASRDTGRALRRLVSADLALARSSLGRALAWVGVAVVFGGSGWLLTAGALIALLQRLGWSWLQSLAFAALLSVAITALAAWKVSRYFDHAGMHATRRQLSRMGLFDEDSDDEDPPVREEQAQAGNTQKGSQQR